MVSDPRVQVPGRRGSLGLGGQQGNARGRGHIRLSAAPAQPKTLFAGESPFYVDILEAILGAC